jgi:hypothetical protein
MGLTAHFMIKNILIKANGIFKGRKTMGLEICSLSVVCFSCFDCLCKKSKALL